MVCRHRFNVVFFSPGRFFQCRQRWLFYIQRLRLSGSVWIANRLDTTQLDSTRLIEKSRARCAAQSGPAASKHKNIVALITGCAHTCGEIVTTVHRDCAIPVQCTVTTDKDRPRCQRWIIVLSAQNYNTDDVFFCAILLSIYTWQRKISVVKLLNHLNWDQVNIWHAIRCRAIMYVYTQHSTISTRTYMYLTWLMMRPSAFHCLYRSTIGGSAAMTSECNDGSIKCYRLNC